jgi:adenylate kinase family enzyme
MQRALVIGCSGTGKSTLARALGGVTGLPVIHVDQLFWRFPSLYRPRLAEAIDRHGAWTRTIMLRSDTESNAFLRNLAAA